MNFSGGVGVGTPPSPDPSPRVSVLQVTGRQTEFSMSTSYHTLQFSRTVSSGLYSWSLNLQPATMEEKPTDSLCNKGIHIGIPLSALAIEGLLPRITGNLSH